MVYTNAPLDYNPQEFDNIPGPTSLLGPTYP